MRHASLPFSRTLVGAVVVGGWAAELTVRRFVDLGRTKSSMCHPASR